MSAEALCCREVVELLDDYLDGASPPSQRGRIQRHLAGCADCDAYLGQLRATIRLARRLATRAAPPSLIGPLLDAYRARAAGGAGLA
jgi:anti-sigma factor RsiW